MPAPPAAPPVPAPAPRPHALDEAIERFWDDFVRRQALTGRQRTVSAAPVRSMAMHSRLAGGRASSRLSAIAWLRYGVSISMTVSFSAAERRERASFAFAVVSLAALLEVEAGRVREVRLVLGGVAHRPWRARLAEDALRGGDATAEAFGRAADVELADARPLRDNAYKVQLARNLLTSTLGDLAGGV